MKVNILTPNTVMLSIWYQDNRTAVTGIIRRADGSVVDNVISETGGYIWEVLDTALEDAKLLKMRHLLMLCNDKKMASIFMRPVCIPQPDSVEYRILPRGKKTTVPSGGCPHMWSILRNTMYFDAWRMMHYEKIQKAKEVWHETNIEN